MDNKIVKLTNAVYKLLEYFPESDMLKNRAKDKALAIMENLLLVSRTDGWVSFQKEKIKAQLSEDIDALLGYFLIAKSHGWLSHINYLIVVNEYEKLKNNIQPVIELTRPQSAPESVLDSAGVSGRQKKILQFLNQNEKAQVMDLQSVLPDVTKRTIRRDLDELLQVGKVARFGEFNQVFYKLA